MENFITAFASSQGSQKTGPIQMFGVDWKSEVVVDGRQEGVVDGRQEGVDQPDR